MVWQILVKVILTIILVYGIIVVWASDIDIKKTILAPFSSVIKFKKHLNIDVNIDNIVITRFIFPGHKYSGNFGLLFYSLKIVNSSEDNCTIKKVDLRYTLDGKINSIAPNTLLTGTGYFPLEKKDVNAIIVRRAEENLVLLNWQNLATEIGEHKVLPPGGVLSGSALFVFEFNEVEKLSNMRNVELVITDYLGEESVQEIKLLDNWIETAKYYRVENKEFTIDPSGKIKYSD